MLARTILARSQACFLIHARGLQSRKGPVLPYYDYPLRDQDYQKPDLPNLMNQEDKDALSTKLKTIWESQSVSSDFSLNSDLSVKSKVLGECAKEFGPIPSNQLGGIGDLRGLVEFYWGLRESLEVPPPPPPPPNLRIYDSIADYREAVVEARKELVKKPQEERMQIVQAAPKPSVYIQDGGKRNHFVYKGIFYPTKTIWHSRKNPEPPKDDPLSEPSSLFDEHGELRREETDPLVILKMQRDRDCRRARAGKLKKSVG